MPYANGGCRHGSQEWAAKGTWGGGQGDLGRRWRLGGEGPQGGDGGWEGRRPREEMEVEQVLNDEIIFRRTGSFWFSGLPVFSRLKAAN